MSLTDVMTPGFELKGSNGAYTALGEILIYYHYNMAIAYSDSQKPVFIYKRLPCEMEVTPYSPLILEAVKSPVFFSLQTDPNKEDNFFKPVTLQEETCNIDTFHPEMSTWIELGPLAFFMTHVENFKIRWNSEEVVVLNVSSKDTKFRKATGTDEERDEIFVSEEDNKYVRTSDIRKNYLSRPSALMSMVITEFGTIYRIYRNTEPNFKTIKERCQESNNAWQQSERAYCYGDKFAPRYILLKNGAIMKTRTDKTVIQMVPPIMTDYVKKLLFTAYEKESELTENMTHDQNRMLNLRRLDLFPCSLELIGDEISFPEDTDTKSPCKHPHRP